MAWYGLVDIEVPSRFSKTSQSPHIVAMGLGALGVSAMSSRSSFLQIDIQAFLVACVGASFVVPWTTVGEDFVLLGEEW